MRSVRQALGPPLEKTLHTVAARGRRLSRARFTLDGVRYPYFSHRYNQTWRNERAVEIPPLLRMLDHVEGGHVLEVGNVMAHYGRRGHDVVDKYEKAHTVDNSDILDLEPTPRYDLVVSVSTLEHVGFDEDEKDPAKPRRAVERMRQVLRPGGRMLVTIPMGYNPALDADLVDGEIPFDRVLFLRRTTSSNRWEEATAEQARSLQYGTPFPWANGVAFGLVGPSPSAA